MGGPNSDQLIEYVRSYDPRSWSCLHIAEGPLNCTGATVQNNDIGPCGSDTFQEWADGISLSCRNSVVRNNIINNPTVICFAPISGTIKLTDRCCITGRWNCPIWFTRVYRRE